MPPDATTWNHLSVWEAEIRPLLPADYQDQARQLRAWTRTRGILTIDALLQSLLCYVFCARSLRKLGAWATVAGLGSISDRAWSRRVRQSTAWALWLVGAILRHNRAILAPSPPGVHIRLIDGSMIRIRSHLGRSVRLHCSYNLLDYRLDQVVITDDHQAEGMHHFAFHPAEIIIADRYYCRRATLVAIQGASAHLIVRWHCTNLPLACRDGTPFDVLTWLHSITGEEAEQEVTVASAHLRLLARRLSSKAAKREAYRRRRKAVKGGRVVQSRTIEFASWLLLLTTLGAEAWPRAEIFTLYRARWQVEMVFKRLKQLVRLHGLPSHLYPTNEAILALLLVGWALIERQAACWRTRIASLSTWQCTALLVDALRAMLWGRWSWSTITRQLEALWRYLRPGRPPHHCWSAESLQTHLNRLLQIA
jgi:hypothetical protein